MEFLTDLVDHGIKIRTLPVHLVDIADAGYMVAVGLTPDGFGLRLDASDGAEDGDGPVEDTEGAFHLHGKVHVAWGVNDVDLVVLVEVFPENSSGGTGDGDPAFLLLDHPIHYRRTFIDFADAIAFARIKKDTFGRSCLTGIYVRHDTDITYIRQVFRHIKILFYL